MSREADKPRSQPAAPFSPGHAGFETAPAAPEGYWSAIGLKSLS